MSEAPETIAQKAPERIIPPGMLRDINAFRIEHGLPSDQDAVQLLLELGLAASRRLRRGQISPLPPMQSHPARGS
jgi:hypothetical protein